MFMARIGLSRVIFGFLAVGCAVYGAAAAPARGQAPIPHDKGAYTQAQYNKVLYEYLKQDVEAYRQHTEDQGEAREQGAKFLDEFYRTFTQQPQAKSLAAILQLGEQQIKVAFTRDPLIVGALGVARSMAGQDGEGTLSDALTELDHGRYRRAKEARLRALRAAAAAKQNDQPGDKKAAQPTDKKVDKPLDKKADQPIDKKVDNQATRRAAKRAAKQSDNPIDKQYESPYGPRQWMRVHLWYVQFAPRHNPHSQQFSAKLLELFKTEKNLAAQRRPLWHDIVRAMRAMTPADRRKLQDEYARLPGADPWLGEMIAGLHANESGWEARGGGFASSVTEEGGKSFEENLHTAAGHFKKAMQIDPKLPEAATYMIQIAMAGGDDQSPRYWFDQTVKLQMDYPSAFSAIQNTLLPRWGGSYSALYHFGVECFETGRYDTEVPMQLFIMLTIIESEAGPQAKVWNRPGVYPKVREMLRGYEASRTLTEAEHYHRLAMLAAVAMRVEDYAEARRALDAMDKIGKDEKVFTATFNALHVDPSSVVARIHASTGDAKDVMPKLNVLLDNIADCESADIDEIEKLLREARAKDRDPDSTRYFDSLAASLPLQRKLLASDWIDLRFDKDSKLWSHTADCTVDFQGATAILLTIPPAVGQTYQNARLQLAARLHVPFEAEVDIEPPVRIPKPADGGKVVTPKGTFYRGYAVTNAMGGVVAGLVDGCQSGRVFAANPDGQGYRACTTGRVPYGEEVPLPPKVHLRVAVWHNAYQWSVADDIFHRETDFGFEPEGLFALGVPESSGRADVKFSRLRIRRLNYGPPPDRSDNEGSVDYFSRVLLVDADSVAAHYWRGMAYQGLGKLDEAAKDLDYVVKHGQHPEKVRTFLDSLRKK